METHGQQIIFFFSFTVVWVKDKSAVSHPIQYYNVSAAILCSIVIHWSIMDDELRCALTLSLDKCLECVVEFQLYYFHCKHHVCNSSYHSRCDFLFHGQILSALTILPRGRYCPLDNPPLFYTWAFVRVYLSYQRTLIPPWDNPFHLLNSSYP